MLGGGLCVVEWPYGDFGFKCSIDFGLLGLNTCSGALPWRMMMLQRVHETC